MELLQNYIAFSCMEIVSVLFLWVRSVLNPVLPRSGQRLFSLAFGCMIAIITAQLGVDIFEQLGAPCRTANAFCNFVGFSLTPFVLLILAMALEKQERRAYLVFLPAVVNAVICALSMRYGLVFSVTAGNRYSRGPAFPLFVLAYLWSFGAYLVFALRFGRQFRTWKYSILTLVLLMTAGTAIQVMFPAVHATWLCATISLVLYYTFLCEFYQRYDTLTGALNRATYESELRFASGRELVQVTVLDVDHFKQINDTYGHAYGDICLAQLAKILENSFAGVGAVYRIGGDEFAVLCSGAAQAQVVACLDVMNSNLHSAQQEDPRLPCFSYGLAEYHASPAGSLRDAVLAADYNMYLHKRGGLARLDASERCK